jgi:anhydro-N-acetylmuramic acid kinase
MSAEFFLGLMTGTSLDGIDAVVADFNASPPIVAAHFEPLPSELRDEFQALLTPGPDEIGRSASAALSLSDLYAQAVFGLIQRSAIAQTDIRAIGCHGQTVRHVPGRGYTVQLVNGARLAELTNIDVVCDFRSRDVAAGGHGAPLVPAFHAAFFAKPGVDRAILNIGGIANITVLRCDGRVTGFDSGPGNALLDEWVMRVLGKPFDANGAWASSGCVIVPLLDALLADRYFTRAPPKSTGREHFNLGWLDHHLQPSYAPQDVQATLAELTAQTAAAAVRAHGGSTTEVFVCGGGAANADLMRRIAHGLPHTRVAPTGELGIHADWVEATAFAWLAREMLERRPGNLPAVTGATGPRVLGCLYPK